MATMNLPKSYRLNGKSYGPGNNIEVPDDVAKKIDRYREMYEGSESVSDSGNVFENQSELGVVYDKQTAKILEASGYRTLDEVKAASDEELLAINGIGDERLKDIRAVSYDAQ